jgi:hypothetical protein
LKSEGKTLFRKKKTLSSAIADRSLYTASYRTLKRYHQEAVAQQLPTGFLETIKGLMSQQMKEQQTRRMGFNIWATVLAAVIGGGVSAFRWLMGK